MPPDKQLLATITLCMCTVRLFVLWFYNCNEKWMERIDFFVKLLLFIETYLSKQYASYWLMCTTVCFVFGTVRKYLLCLCIVHATKNCRRLKCGKTIGNTREKKERERRRDSIKIFINDLMWCHLSSVTTFAVGGTRSNLNWKQKQKNRKKNCNSVQKKCLWLFKDDWLLVIYSSFEFSSKFDSIE